MDNALENRRIIAVVPAYNERDNIVSTIEDLRNNAPRVDYVIVNDGSKDDTLSVCREHGYNVIDLPVNLGLAGAFQTGMRYAVSMAMITPFNLMQMVSILRLSLPRWFMWQRKRARIS